jgi:addiction module RelE/StbE family toxin
VRILWSSEALDDLENILAYYDQETSQRVAEAVEKRIIGEIAALPPYLERIRASDRVPGTRELVVNKLPYIVFVQVRDDALIILNIVHTRKKFPAWL